MTSFGNEVILFEYVKVWDLDGKSTEIVPVWLISWTNFSSVPWSQLAVLRIRPGYVSQRQEHKDREAGPQQQGAGQGLWFWWKQRVQAESGRGFIGHCSTSQTLAIIKITWKVLKTHIAGFHSQCFRFGRYEMRPQDLHFKQVPMTLMLLVQEPLFENYLDSERIATPHL